MKLERLKKVLSEYKWAIALLMLTLAVNTLEITSEYDKDELIRFHVMADNDTVQAQADKLAVKDAVVSFMQQELADSESVEESRAIIQKDMPKMKNIALETLKERGETEKMSRSFMAIFTFL